MFFVAWSCGAARAEADPIRVTSGFVFAGFGPLRTPLNGENLELSGAGFRVLSSLEDEEAFVQLVSVPTLADGALVDLSGTLFVEDVVNAQLNGALGQVAAPFTIAFAAMPTRLTCLDNGSFLDCTGVAPFTFAADLTFIPGFDGRPITQHLVGGGTAEGRLSRRGSFENAGVLYTFQASPTPEPASLSLIATGAIIMGGALRRRCARRSAGGFQTRFAWWVTSNVGAAGCS